MALALGMGMLHPAHADEEVIIDYRKGMMKAIGGNMASLGAVLDGRRLFAGTRLADGDAAPNITPDRETGIGR